MPDLPLDILYSIYFFIDDYLTACNFWLLSKDFHANYMSKYNATYKHKFNILYNDLYNFLSCLPTYTYNINCLDGDLNFYIYIITSCVPIQDKPLLHKDATFIYNLIRKNCKLHTLNNLKFNKNKILK